MKTKVTGTKERNNNMRFITKLFSMVALMFASAGLMADPVAKVGDTEYDTIEAAIAAWNQGSTLTLLQDVEVSYKVEKTFTIHPGSAPSYILVLGTHRWVTKGADAFYFFVTGDYGICGDNGLKVYATGEGGITVDSSKYCFHPVDDSSVVKTVKDNSGNQKGLRMGIYVNGGVYDGGFLKTDNNYNAYNTSRFYLNDNGAEGQLVVNGKIDCHRSHIEFYGGTYNGTIANYCYGGTQYDSFSSGTKFKSLPTASNQSGKSTTFYQMNGNWLYYDGEYWCVMETVSNPGAYVDISYLTKLTGWTATATHSKVGTTTVQYSTVKDKIYCHDATDFISKVDKITICKDSDANKEIVNSLGKTFTLVRENESVYSGMVTTLSPMKVDAQTDGATTVYTVVVDEEKLVATVRSSQASSILTYYDDAAKAMDAVKYGYCVTLYKDCSIDKEVTCSKAGTALVIEIENGAAYTGVVSANVGFVLSTSIDPVTGTITYTASVDPAFAQAKIGDVYYLTVQDAISSAPSGSEIVLNKDVTVSSYVSVSKKVTINLSGHTFTTANRAGGVLYAQKGSDVTIIDSVAPAGSMSNTAERYNDNYYLIRAQDGAKVTVAAGNYSSKANLFNIYQKTQYVKASTINIIGGTFVGTLSCGDGSTLAITGGTFDHDPAAFIPVDSGKIARDNGDGTWTVQDPDIHVDTKTEPETREVVIESKEPLTEEQQAKAASEVETIKTNLVEALIDPVVASADTGIKGTVTEESKQEIVKALEKNAAEQGLTEAAKEQIQKNIDEFLDEESDSNSSSNFLNIAVQAVDTKIVASDTTVASVEAKATVVVYEVKPIIETVVSNTVGGVTEVKVVTAIIPNETVKELAEQGRPMTFNLPIEDPQATCATVKHVSAEPDKYPTETFTCPVWEQGGKRYITISVAHFSTFEVSTSGAVLVDSDETIGITKLDRMTAGFVSFGVPYTKSGVTTETKATLGQLLVTGVQSGEFGRSWVPGWDDMNNYKPIKLDTAVTPGQPFWYERAADSLVPLTLAGYTKETLVTTGAASTTDRPGLSNFVNPKKEAFDVLAVLTSTPADGDQIVIEGDTTRYFYEGGWKKRVPGAVLKEASGVTVRGVPTTEAVTSIPVAKGRTFWYISMKTAASVEW